MFAVSAASLDSMINDSNYFQHVLGGARFHNMAALFTRYTSLLMEARKQALALRNTVIHFFENSIIYRNHERDLRQNLTHKGGFWSPLHEDIGTFGPSDLVARSELLQLSRVKVILDSSIVQHSDLKKVADSRILSLRWAIKLLEIAALHDGASGGVADLPPFRKLEQLEAASHSFLRKSHLFAESERVFPRQLCACLRDRLAAAKEWTDAVFKTVPHLCRASARKKNHALPNLEVLQELYQHGLEFRLSFDVLSRLEEMIDEGHDAERRAAVALHASRQQDSKKEETTNQNGITDDQTREETCSTLETLKQQYEQVSRCWFALQIQHGPNSQKVEMLLSHVIWRLKVSGIQQSGEMLTLDSIEELLSEFDSLESSRYDVSPHVSVSEEYVSHISHAKGDLFVRNKFMSCCETSPSLV